jgi:hypothetical protein
MLFFLHFQFPSPTTDNKENKTPKKATDRRKKITLGKDASMQESMSFAIGRNQRVPNLLRVVREKLVGESAYKAKAATARAKAITLEATMLEDEAAPSYSACWRVLFDWTEPELAGAEPLVEFEAPVG